MDTLLPVACCIRPGLVIRDDLLGCYRRAPLAVSRYGSGSGWGDNGKATEDNLGEELHCG